MRDFVFDIVYIIVIFVYRTIEFLNVRNSISQLRKKIMVLSEVCAGKKYCGILCRNMPRRCVSVAW